MRQVSKQVCANNKTFNLTQENVRIPTLLDIVEVTTVEGLSRLALMFGGVQKKFPPVHKDVAVVGIGDNSNLLLPIYTNKNKVCFHYEYGESKLNVPVRYTNVIVDANFHTTYLTGVPQGDLMQHGINQNDATQVAEDQVDIADLQLMIGSPIYRVSSVQNQNVHVVAEYGSWSSLNIPEDHANELVDKFNL